MPNAEKMKNVGKKYEILLTSISERVLRTRETTEILILPSPLDLLHSCFQNNTGFVSNLEQQHPVN